MDTENTTACGCPVNWIYCSAGVHIFRILQRQLDEERQKSQQLDTKNEQLREEIKQKENFNAARIASLSR